MADGTEQTALLQETTKQIFCQDSGKTMSKGSVSEAGGHVLGGMS